MEEQGRIEISFGVFFGLSRTEPSRTACIPPGFKLLDVFTVTADAAPGHHHSPHTRGPFKFTRQGLIPLRPPPSFLAHFPFTLELLEVATPVVLR